MCVPAYLLFFTLYSLTEVNSDNSIVDSLRYDHVQSKVLHWAEYQTNVNTSPNVTIE